MLKQVTPNLMVEDVNATVAYYRQVLGFRVAATAPESGALDWAMVERDGVRLMFQSRASLSGEIPALSGAPIGGSLTLYVEVTALRQRHEDLKDRVEMVQPLNSTFYDTMEFAFRDCNGYILAFAESRG